MRFRYSIKRCLVSVALVAIGAWWLTWPQATFNRFVFCIEGGNYDVASVMVAPSERTRVHISSSGIQLADQQVGGHGSEFIGSEFVRSSFHLESTSVLDILLSQRRYRRRDLIMGDEVIEMEPSAFQLLVKWGKIYPGSVQ